MMAPPEAHKSSVSSLSRQSGIFFPAALETSLDLLDVSYFRNPVQSLVECFKYFLEYCGYSTEPGSKAHVIVVKQSKGLPTPEASSCRVTSRSSSEKVSSIIDQHPSSRPTLQSLTPSELKVPVVVRDKVGTLKRLHIDDFPNCIYSILASQGDKNTYCADCAPSDSSPVA